MDACLNEPFCAVQKPPDLFGFVFPALAVTEAFDAVHVMFAAQLCNGKAFRPVECINDDRLILPLHMRFQHEFQFLLQHLPAGGLRQPPNVHFGGAALAVNKDRSRQLCRQGSLANAFLSVDDQLYAGAGLNAVCFFKIHLKCSFRPCLLHGWRFRLLFLIVYRIAILNNDAAFLTGRNACGDCLQALLLQPLPECL